MTIYFTSDLHFHHAKIMEFAPTFRPCSNVDEMNEYLIEQWNAVVKPDDVVYNLGDVSFSRKINAVENVLKRLNGIHHLILGNHDHIIHKNSERLLSEVKNDGNPMLSSINNYKMVWFDGHQAPFILCHYPIEVWDRANYGSIHLYGHLHCRLANVLGKTLNVGWDLHGAFLTLDDVMSIVGALPNVIRHEVQPSFNAKVDINDNRQAIIQALHDLNH